MTESSCCFWKCDRSAGHRFCVMVCADFGLIIMYSFTPTVRSWWSQWVIMAACHCYLWWRWWSDTLWVVLIRLWPHSLLCYLQIVVEISLQFDRYTCNCPYWILLVMQGISVRVRRPSDYNPAMAATLGPSQPSGHLNLAAVGLTPGYSFTCIFVCIWVSMVEPFSMDLSCWIYQQSNKTKPDQNAAFLCSWVYSVLLVSLAFLSVSEFLWSNQFLWTYLVGFISSLTKQSQSRMQPFCALGSILACMFAYLAFSFNQGLRWCWWTWPHFCGGPALLS